MPKHTLEHAGMVRLLVYLFLNRDKNNDFTSTLSGIKPIAIASLRRTLEIAKKVGLIEEERNPNFPYESKFTLTSTGLKVAAHLAEVLTALKSKGQ